MSSQPQLTARTHVHVCVCVYVCMCVHMKMEAATSKRVGGQVRPRDRLLLDASELCVCGYQLFNHFNLE